MIKFENVEIVGWEAAIRGMRNPINSWDKTDSGFGCEKGKCEDYCELACGESCGEDYTNYIVGQNDMSLMKRLREAGTDHRKFMRMLTVYVDITAPLYWWKEFDTYKVGTVANSCSTMHKIHEKEFTLEDFSCEQLLFSNTLTEEEWLEGNFDYSSISVMRTTIEHLNKCREMFLKTKDKKYWWQMIQLLPSSYNQKRTVMLNYEVLANIYKSRKNHKLDEWCWHEGIIDGDKTNKSYIGLCDWIETLPYSELITGNKEKEFALSPMLEENIRKTVVIRRSDEDKIKSYKKDALQA